MRYACNAATDPKQMLKALGKMPQGVADPKIVLLNPDDFGVATKRTAIGNRSKPLDLQGKDITEAALGLNDLGCARVLLQPAPEAKNLHVYASVEDVFVHSGRLQKVLPAERALRSVKEGDKQRIFPFRQRNFCPIRIGKSSGAKIELPGGKPISATFCLACRRGPDPVEPSNDRAHPRQKLAQVERLRHIVVGAELKTDDSVDLIPAVAGDYDDWHIKTRAELAQRVEPIFEPEPKIEDHDVNFLRGKLAEHLLATGR